MEAEARLTTPADQVGMSSDNTVPAAQALKVRRFNPGPMVAGGPETVGIAITRRGDHLQDSLSPRLQSWVEVSIWCIVLIEIPPGVVLIARGLESPVAAVPSHRRVNKLYEAEVKGQLQGRGRIDARLARLERDPPRYGDHPQGRPATTLWRVRERRAESTTLWLRPLTGRSHQLRAHLAGIGHPILGDPIYGEKRTTSMRVHARARGFHTRRQGRVRVSTGQKDDHPGAQFIRLT